MTLAALIERIEAIPFGDEERLHDELCMAWPTIRDALKRYEEAARICEQHDGWDMNPKDYAKLIRAAAEEVGRE